MNQILVTEKLYITPELKRKKKIYKFYFILSVFVVCILTSFYIYAEYDRNKSADESKQLLADINQTLAETAEDTTIAKDDILLVVLNGTKEDSQVEDKQLEEKQNTDVATANEKAEWKTSASGYRYKIIATVQIPIAKVTIGKYKNTNTKNKYPIYSSTRRNRKLRGNRSIIKKLTCKISWI